MAELGNYKISAGSKLSYATLTDNVAGEYTDLKGCTQIPQLLSAPEGVDSTTLDNLKNKTSVPGLQDLGQIEFPFNLEIPDTTANINVIASLDKNKTYAWKVTYASGITLTIHSKPSYYFNEVGVNELESFTLVLTPENDLEPTIPKVAA